MTDQGVLRFALVWPEPRAPVRAQRLRRQGPPPSRIGSRLAAAHFWESRSTQDQTGIDGENWIIEGREADRYRVVDQWSPPRSDAFGAARTRFLGLAKMTTAAAPELYAE